MFEDSLNIDKKPKKEKERVKLNLNDIQKLDSLGNGVSGQVFKAQNVKNGKLFAMKVIPYKEDNKLKELIETEVKTLHKCKSDYIIKVYATNCDGGTVDILLEYMDRGTLTDVLKKVKKIPESILGIMTAQMICGLWFLHNNKIIHRDIKPSNILLNSKGFVKISDFGVSGYLKDTNEERNTMLGTYMYMAPERITQSSYNVKCDIWSLGMSLIECATGMNPFVYNKNDKNVAIKDYWDLVSLLNNKEDPPKLNKFEFSDEFCDFIDCCLVKDQSKRYSTDQLKEHKFFKKYSQVPQIELVNWMKETLK